MFTRFNVQNSVTKLYISVTNKKKSYFKRKQLFCWNAHQKQKWWLAIFDILDFKYK